MDTLDRLDWAAGMAFTSHGVRIGIRANDPSVMPRIASYLPPVRETTTSPRVERLYSVISGGPSAQTHIRRFHLVYANHTRIARVRDEEQALDALEADVQLFVAETARRRLFVHAGVVTWRGQAIVMPGESFKGKTTLVAEFIRAGATYYSDEYAVFDPLGRVHPYPRPLGVREPANAKRTKFSADTLGGRTGAVAAPVGLVIVSEYKPGARWRPQAISAGQGAMALLANTVAARRKPESMLSTFQRVLSDAMVLQGARGEAQEVVDSILKSFAL